MGPADGGGAEDGGTDKGGQEWPAVLVLALPCESMHPSGLIRRLACAGPECACLPGY